MKYSFKITLILALSVLIAQIALAQNYPALQYLDVFQLEWASQPQLSPDGTKVVYLRNGFDITTDKSRQNLWLLDLNTNTHEKLTASDVNESHPVWSPTGDRVAYVRPTEQGSEIFVHWIKSGKEARLTQLEASPSNIKWSPDGKHLAFTMFIEAEAPVLVKMPKAPKGAEWAKPARITDRLKHESDGSGYINPGFTHIFMIPADGGSPRQLTSGNYNHAGSFSFSRNGKTIYFSANRTPDWEYNFRTSYIYNVNVQSGNITQLTKHNGPAHTPIVSPDGKHIAFLGFKDKKQAYQPDQIWIMNPDGTKLVSISKDLDRNISDISWNANSKSLYITYDTEGNTKLAEMDLNGKLKVLASNIGGTTIGRPYASGSFSVAANSVVFTKTTPKRPSDLAILDLSSKEEKTITDLNADILGYKTLGDVESVWYTSSIDGRKIQGWIVKPPFYEASKTYPLLVENHGGPILNYGDRFTAEIQLYAAAGYLVFYPNPRGSTSYGEEFGNLLYNNYPGEDYNDVMDGVDYLIEKGIANPDQLFVTGGSAGGIMTAWIIGKNNRFKAAVVAKPVMNWISKTLVADNYYGYANSRYPGQPWENFETYWKFSPISLVGNIQTPTMVMVGLEDLRTPPSEAKQLYHALKLRKIETILVELPGASHGIANRPSQLISKVAHTLSWFEAYLNDKKD